MRIHFDNVNLNASTGPNTFASRLAKELYRVGHEVVFERAGAAISLVFIEPSGALLAPKVVQRLDGVWFKPHEFETKNVAIKSLYERADAVVWQSDFDRNFVCKWWGHPLTRGQKSATISNGIEIEPVTQFSSPELAHLRSQYDQVFVCSANWHPQKRLKSNTEAYLHIRKTIAPKSALIVMGSNPDHVIADPHVFYTGSVPKDVYMQVYSMANWMIHLAYLDHCPNSVIECLSQGTPVIYPENGGTRELVKGFGICINEDSIYNNELVDYDIPPRIDVSFINSLVKMEDRLHESYDTHADITIETCAKKYIDLFTSLV